MNQLVDIDQSASMRVGSVFKADEEQTLNGGDLETLNGGNLETLNGGNLETLNGGDLDLEGRTFLAGDIADANSDFHSNLIEEDLIEDQQEHEMSA